MQRFPQALFLAGGVEVIEGRNFTSKLVRDEAELEASLAAGWHETTDAAAAAEDAAKHAEQGATGDDGKQPEGDGGAKAPTRAELEAEAKALDVQFSAKLGDAKLAERIAAKRAELGA